MPGQWAGGIVGLKSILKAKSRAEALGIMDNLVSLGYICYELDEKTKKLTYCINVTTLSPEEHDEMIGFLSQLTRCIAITLMTCNNKENMEKFTGDSFRDLTRIARINDLMWSNLFAFF